VFLVNYGGMDLLEMANTRGKRPSPDVRPPVALAQNGAPGGCPTSDPRIGALRNKLSDAHGKGVLLAKPEARHAEMAANLAGTMSTFLISTWKEENPQET
jgi:hypothetical protein